MRSRKSRRRREQTPPSSDDGTTSSTSSDEDIRSSRSSTTSKLCRLCSCGGCGSTKSKTSVIERLSSTNRKSSMTSPEVGDTEGDVWRLNGEPLSCVVRRVMAAPGSTTPDDVISGETGRKSYDACAASLNVDNYDVTPTDGERRRKQPSPAPTGSDVINNGNRPSPTGTSNGGETCADGSDDLRRVVGLPQRDVPDVIPRHNRRNRDIPDVNVRRDSGITQTRENPYSKQMLDSGCARVPGVESKLIDCRTKESNNIPTSGTPDASDVIKMENVTQSSSSDAISRETQYVRVAPEPEINENDVTGKRSLEEERDATGHGDQRRPRATSRENWTRTGAKARQRVWKDVDSELVWRLGTTLSVWNGPTATTTNRKSRSRSEDTIDNDDDRQRPPASNYAMRYLMNKKNADQFSVLERKIKSITFIIVRHSAFLLSFLSSFFLSYFN